MIPWTTSLVLVALVGLPPPPRGDSRVVRVTDFGAEPDSRTNAVAAVSRALEACRGARGPDPRLPEGPLRLLAPARRREGLLRVEHHGRQPQAAGHLHRGLRRPDRGRRRLDLRLPRPDAAVHRGPLHARSTIRDRLDRLGHPAERRGGRRGRDRGPPRPADRRPPVPLRLSRTASSSSSGEGWKSGWWDAMEFDGRTLEVVPGTGDAGCLGPGWKEYRAEALAPGPRPAATAASAAGRRRATSSSSATASATTPGSSSSTAAT